MLWGDGVVFPPSDAEVEGAFVAVESDQLEPLVRRGDQWAVQSQQRIVGQHWKWLRLERLFIEPRGESRNAKERSESVKAYQSLVLCAAERASP